MSSEKIIVLYERLSREDENLGESYSISNQKKLLEDYCREKGWTRFRHFTDDGISGTTFERPSFKEMISLVEDGEVETIVLKDMSRLGRDYLVVGQLREFFRKKGVRLIAINDNHDSSNGDDDFLVFRDVMNEMYAKDISKKIRSTFKSKGKSGKHVASVTPYGYLKDENDGNHWIIDEEAAEVVRRIFNMCLNGKGPYQIARELAEDKVERPEYYLGIRGRGVNTKSFDMEHPYAWRGATVKDILMRMEYTGCTVNFRTKKESYKDKRPTKVDSSEWIIFEDTQEPIIDKHTWETVQKLLDTPRRKGVFEENNPLTGKVFCADCGAKMYNHRHSKGVWKKNYFKAGEMIYHAPEDRYDCSNNIRGRQRYEKLCCSHSITTKALETLVLETIKRTCDYAVENEAEFRETVCSISEEQQGELSVRLEKRLAKKQKRVSEINRLIRKLYEDNISGKLNDKRFNAMLSDYESELEALEEDIDRDNAELEGMSAKKTDVDVFMELVKKHTTFEELTPAILNEFVDKIMVYKAVGSGANRTQDVDIYLNYIGRFVVPEVVVELTEEEKLAEAKRQEKLEKKRASNRKYMARKREEARKAWAEIEAEKAKAVGQ